MDARRAAGAARRPASATGAAGRLPRRRLDYGDEGAAPTTGSLRAAREQVVAGTEGVPARRSVVVGGYSEGIRRGPGG